MLTLPFTLALHRLMLTDTSAPHGWDAGHSAAGYFVRVHTTTRYRFVATRRVLLMGQQVRSRQTPDNQSDSFHVEGLYGFLMTTSTTRGSGATMLLIREIRSYLFCSLPKSLRNTRSIFGV